MNKGPSTSVAKTPASLPSKSAWAKGPPQATSSAPTPRTQSPAPSASQTQSQSHSRRSSQLGSFKDAVSVGIASGSRGNVPPSKTTSQISFGTVNGSVTEKASTPSSSPAPAPSLVKSESRPVQSFGSIEATQSSMSTTAKPPPTIASTASTGTPSTRSTASTAKTTPAPTPATATTKPKVDVSAFFRGPANGTKPSSPVNASFSDSIGSPPMRSNTLSPAVPPPQSQNANAPGGPGPHPHAHLHQPPPQPYQQPFVPASMRNQNVGNGPRSPSFQRAMPNGGGARPPVNGQPGANNNNMPSPRLPPPPHLPHQHQHQHQQPSAPVQGMPQQMQMPPSWAGAYYYPFMPGMSMQGVPGAEHYMQYQPQGWHMPAPPHPHQGPGANGPPQTPLAQVQGLPVASPRQPPPPLAAPGTPPAGVSAPLPNAGAGARLNTNASAFVPSQPGPPQAQRLSKITIKDPSSGHEVDFSGVRHKVGTPSSTPTSNKNGRTPIRVESEETRLKRIAEEREKKAKEEDERKKREAKEAAERKRREEEEKAKAEEKTRVEKERKRKEEEERLRKEEEEKERVRLEEESKRKKEEEERERIRKEEEERERVRKEEEARRLKEEEERRQRQEEEERRLKEEDEERQRKQVEEERLRKEEEETKAKAEVDAAAERSQPAPLEIKSKKEGEAASSVSDVPLSMSPETSKRRPIPGPLDLSSTHKNVAQPLPSALATARHIQDVYQVPYPEGIRSPKPELNANAKNGKFRYDRDFLLQFMSVCKEKPDNLPSLEAIGLEPSDQSHSMGRGGSGRRGVSGSMGPPSSTASRQASASVGLGFNTNVLSGKPGSNFAMGNFSAPNKLSSDERFMRSTSMSGGPGALPFAGGRPSPIMRSSSQGGPGAMGNKRTRSKRGDSTRNESNRIHASNAQFNMSTGAPFEPVAPLEQSANRWVAGSTSRRPVPIDADSPEIVDKKVRSLLNKLTMEKFESISNQIIAWANKSENEKDGRTLIQVIRLVFEKATDEAAWSEMYARLCRKMMEQISPDVQDEGIRNAEGKPITGGLLFRKYLLNRCQEDFERGWTQKESTAAAALVKATEDQAIKDANENSKETGESALYSEEYYAAQKAKRQGLGLIKFIGELFKLQMLTERIMHECIKKLLSNVDNPEEEEIESLCKLLTTVGQALDTSKARGHMDVYFSRMKELAKSSNVSSRMQFMLQDVIELRERKWASRNAVAAPTTLAQVHENAAKEKAQQEQYTLSRAAMSRGGSRRGHDRDGNAQVGPDGWAVASGPARPTNKAGDLTNFGKIQKGSGGTMSFGPASVFSKKGDSKRDGASLSRASSNTNMFQMLQAAEAANEAPAATTSHASRPSSRTASVDLTHNAPAEPTQPLQRPKLNLLPRSKPLLEKSEASPAESQDGDEREDGEIVEKDAGKPSMSNEQAERKIEQDRKEFFAIRDLIEAEEYFSTLPSEYRHILVEKLVLSAVEAKEADAKLVADLFERAISRNLCSPASFEDGFLPIAETIDDIAIDAPKAFNLLATMMKGAKLDEERRTRIASKSMDSDKLLGLLA